MSAETQAELLEQGEFSFRSTLNVAGRVPVALAFVARRWGSPSFSARSPAPGGAGQGGAAQSPLRRDQIRL